MKLLKYSAKIQILGGFGGRSYFYKDRRLVFARLKIRSDRSRDDNEEESQKNEHPTDAEDTPVVEEMEPDFFGMCHGFPGAKRRRIYQKIDPTQKVGG
jgi:hypothetical protein